MDCMAAMPCAAGRRARAFIMKAEKAKKTPAISPQPSAVKSVKAKSNLSVILGLQYSINIILHFQLLIIHSWAGRKAFFSFPRMEDVELNMENGVSLNEAPYTNLVIFELSGKQRAENVVAPLSHCRSSRRLRRPRFRNGVRL